MLYDDVPALINSHSVDSPQWIYLTTELPSQAPEEMCAEIDISSVSQICRKIGYQIFGYGSKSSRTFSYDEDTIYLPRIGEHTTIIFQNVNVNRAFGVEMVIRKDLCRQKTNNIVAISCFDISYYEMFHQNTPNKDTIRKYLEEKAALNTHLAGFCSPFMQFRNFYDGLNLLFYIICRREPNWSSPYSEPALFEMHVKKLS